MCACERVCGEGGIGGGRIEISTIRTLVVNNTTVAIETWWLPHRLTKILLVYTMKPCTQPTQAFSHSTHQLQAGRFCCRKNL